MIRKPKKLILFALISIGFILTLSLFDKVRMNLKKKSVDKISESGLSQADVITNSGQPNRKDTRKDLKSNYVTGIESMDEIQLSNFLEKESARVGSTDANPEQTEEYLYLLAQKFNENQLKQLEKTAIDMNKDGDLRSLSAYLLSLSQNESSLDLLKDLAENEIPKNINDRQLSFEEVIRGQAIEGIINFPNKGKSEKYLKELNKRVASNFLADRALRGLSSLQNGTDSPTEQEHKALKKILKTTR